MARQNTEAFNASEQPKSSSGSKNRGASKKNYQNRNKDWAITNRNKAKDKARRDRRAAYWKTAEGQSRKFEKMNTPEKLQKEQTRILGRNKRRADRKAAEQSASRSVNS